MGRLRRVRRDLSEAVALCEGVSMNLLQWRRSLRLPEINQARQNKTAMEMLGFVNDGAEPELLVKYLPEQFASLAGKSHVFRRLKIEAIYQAVAEAERLEVEAVRRDEALVIPPDVDYTSSKLSLSNEDREKLLAVLPQTIAAASRVQGISPSTVIRLLQYVKGRGGTPDTQL